MANLSILTIGEYELMTKWDIDYVHLILFNPSQYRRHVFLTTVQDAKKKLASRGLTLKQIEQEIYNLLSAEEKKFLRKHKTIQFDEEEWIFDDLIEQGWGDLVQLYVILKYLEQSKADALVKFDVREIAVMSEGQWYRDINRLFEDKEQEFMKKSRAAKFFSKGADVFICHDSRDKQSFVRPLAKALKAKGVKVWYDEYSLEIGDNLLDKIQEGLKFCNYAIVIISKNFLQNRRWTHFEYSSVRGREIESGKTIILPIWRRDISKKDIIQYSQDLALKVAGKESEGLNKIVTKLVKILKRM